MVVKCHRCYKEFKFECYLNKHLNNKSLCRESEKPMRNTQNHIEEAPCCMKKASDCSIECKFCKQPFKSNWNLKNHAKSCKKQFDHIAIYELELGIEPIEEPQTCRFCKFKFNMMCSYQRHMRSGCKEKDNYEKELEAKVLKARVALGNQTIHNTTNNNIQTQNNTINIHLPALRAFGDENLDYITVKEVLKQLKKVQDVTDVTSLISNLTKLIHANPAHPENHNVQIPSLNGAHGRVYNGLQFENEDVLTIQDKILNKIGNTIVNRIDTDAKEDQKIHNQIGDKNVDHLLYAVEDDIKGEIGRSSDLQTRKYRHKVKNVLYNNKLTITSTEKAHESKEDSIITI
jgi:hypothetical protein